MKTVAILTLMVLLGGCATTKPVIKTEIVRIKVPEYQTIPSFFLAPCLTFPKGIKTNGNLLSAYEFDQNSLGLCNNQLSSIKNLVTPPTSGGTPHA